MMTAEDEFAQSRRNRIQRYAGHAVLQELARSWVFHSMREEYLYNFDWLGRPVIQYPQDLVALQELIFSVKPSLIIETGIAHGGSVIFSASMLALLDYLEAVERGTPIVPANSQRQVLGIDIEIRPHNLQALNNHPLRHLLQLVEGSSLDPGVIEQAGNVARQHASVMVFLDSNHVHEHVLSELRAYAPLVSVGSYCVVLDTFIENMPEPVVPTRPWAPGNSPLSAARQFLHEDGRFEVDSNMDTKLLITAAPSGYLRRHR